MLQMISRVALMALLASVQLAVPAAPAEAQDRNLRITPLSTRPEFVTGGDVSSADEIRRGSGAVIRRGLAKVAVYRDDAGALVERSAICTHLGCVVRWNDVEKSWDCPCHGSRFDPWGTVLNGPAVSPLKPADSSKGEQ